MEIKLHFHWSDLNTKGKMLIPQNELVYVVKRKIREFTSIPNCFFFLSTKILETKVLMNESFPISFYADQDIAVQVEFNNKEKWKRFNKLVNSIKKNSFQNFLKNKQPDFDLYSLQALPNSWNCLHLAAQVGASEILSEMVKESSEFINTETEDNWTVLMLAAANGHLDICKRLGKIKSLKINYANKRGTALHCAVVAGYKEVVEYLLLFKASVLLEDEKGRKPIELTKDPEILEIVAKFHGFLEMSKIKDKPIFAGEVLLYNSGFFSDSCVFLYVNIEKGLLEEYENKASFMKRGKVQDYFYLSDVEVRKMFENSWNFKGCYYFQVATYRTTKVYYSKDKEVRDEWVEKIEKAVFYVKEEQKHAFPVIDFEEVEQQLWLDEVNVDEFERIIELGSGSFASVYKVKRKSTGVIYAMKCLSISTLEKKKMLSYAKSEIKIMKSLSYPFVLKLLTSFSNTTCMYLLLEFCEKGDLETIIEHRKLSEIEAKFVLGEIVLALEYLHSKNIIYRDLKPANVLIDKNGHVRLADFGLAKAFKDTDFSVSTMVGSPAYMSPEILNREYISRSTDIYAFGIVMHQVLTGDLPFGEMNVDKLFELIKKSKFQFSKDLSKNAVDLIRLMLSRKTHKRPGYEQIKSHPFFNGIDWKVLEEKRYLSPLR